MKREIIRYVISRVISQIMIGQKLLDGAMLIEGVVLSSSRILVGEEHAHTFVWKSDATKHWKECPFAEIETRSTEEHTFNAGEITKAPTTTATGIKTYESACLRLSRSRRFCPRRRRLRILVSRIQNRHRHLTIQIRLTRIPERRRLRISVRQLYPVS